MSRTAKPKGKLSISLPSLFFQLFAIIILPLTVLLLVVTFGSFTLHQQAMRSLVGERDQRAVQTATKTLESEIDHRIADIKSLATRASGPITESRVEILSTSDYFLHDFDDGLAFYDKDGNEIASIGNRVFWNQLTQTKPSALPSALSQGNSLPIISNSFPNPINNQPVILVSMTSRNWVVLGAFSPEALINSTLKDTFQTGNQSSVYVLDSNGEILYQNGSLNPNGNPCAHPDVVTICKNQGGMTYLKVGKSEHVIAYSPATPTGWGLVTEESWQNVESPLLQNTLIAPLVLIPVLLISGLLLFALILLLSLFIPAPLGQPGIAGVEITKPCGCSYGCSLLRRL